MSSAGTAFDITPLMVPYLDTHMIIPMLDFLRDPQSVLRDEKSTNEDKVGGCRCHTRIPGIDMPLCCCYVEEDLPNTGVQADYEGIHQGVDED